MVKVFPYKSVRHKCVWYVESIITNLRCSINDFPLVFILDFMTNNKEILVNKLHFCKPWNLYNELRPVYLNFKTYVINLYEKVTHCVSITLVAEGRSGWDEICKHFSTFYKMLSRFLYKNWHKRIKISWRQTKFTSWCHWSSWHHLFKRYYLCMLFGYISKEIKKCQFSNWNVCWECTFFYMTTLVLDHMLQNRYNYIGYHCK